MSEIFKKNQILKIVPENIELSCKMTINEVKDDFVTASTVNPTPELAGNIEAFMLHDVGIIYFVSKLETTDTPNVFKIFIPENYKTLQRREYSRIILDEEVNCKTINGNFKVYIKDISAGGMQIVSPHKLDKISGAKFKLELDKETIIDTTLLPIRQSETDDKKFLISGRFKALTNYQRISLVQFCFKKQMENSYK